MPDQQTYLAPDLVPRLAAIDIGSNSIRLVVAEAKTGGQYRILDEERESTRLGRSLASTGRLDDESIETSLAALRRFISIANGLGVESVHTIATCAVREATNGHEFCQRVAEQLDLPIEVISDGKEAHLAFHSVRRRFDLAGENSLLVDIGGGSAEIVLATGELIEAIYTTNLGAVRLAEKFGGGQAMAGDDYDRMQKWIDRQLKKNTDKLSIPPNGLARKRGRESFLVDLARNISTFDGIFSKSEPENMARKYSRPLFLSASHYEIKLHAARVPDGCPAHFMYQFTARCRRHVAVR